MHRPNNTLLCPTNERGKAKNFSSNPAHVYVIQDENNVIKIGHSTNPSKRIKQIQRCCGLCVVRQHISPLCYNHLEIENALLNEFSDRLKQGEHLQGVSFEEVCAALDKQPFLVASPTTPAVGLLPFQFQEHSIRVFVDEHRVPWFVAKDVCIALGIEWKGSATLANIPKEWRILRKFRTILENQHGTYGETEKSLIFINESALYKLIFRSNKKEADIFSNWVAGEVLPQIRQKGYYSLYGQVTPSTQSLVNDIAQNTVAKITETLAPLTQNPVVIVKAHDDGTTKKVEVSFLVKLSFEIKEL